MPTTDFHYVYVLQSESVPTKHYTGQTANLKQRLRDHNSGKVAYTSKFMPWVVRCATAFSDKQKAMAFERYLKTGSGRAFLQRHF